MVGQQWWHMTAECGRELIRFLHENPWYESFFRQVHIPDEAFFQTFLGASRFAADLGEPPSWQRMDGYSAALIGVDDIRIAQASRRPFARKFDIQQEPDAVKLALECNINSRSE